MPLTSRQQQILELIRSALAETGMPPTRAEIAAQLGFRSPNAAEDHLRALARKGVIELLPGASRGIRLMEGGPRLGVGVPIVGRVAAGRPILASAHIEDYCQIAPALFRPKADYLLRVRGMSMRDAGILNGDLLAVHATPEARNGQIVVVRIDDEVTVKRWRRNGGRVTLEAENPEFPSIEVNPRQQNLAVEGLAVGVLRRKL